jgi:type I restriction enzyme S subunit
VLYGSRRTYLRKLAVADFEGITANTTFVLEPKSPDILLPELLPYLLQAESFHQHSIRRSKGSVNPYVNFSDLSPYTFELPPLDQQRQIAEIAQRAMELANRAGEVRATAEAAVTSVREELYSSNLCEPVPLSKLVDRIVAGRSLAGSNTAPASGRFGVLKISAVVPGGLRPEESKTLLDQSAFKPELSVMAGDLLITRANTSDLVGLCCLVKQDCPNLMLSDKTLRLVPVSGVSAPVLAEALKTRAVRRQLKAAATGTGGAMKNISQQKFMSIQVPYPKDHEKADLTATIMAETYAGLGSARKYAERCRDFALSVTSALLEPRRK